MKKTEIKKLKVGKKNKAKSSERHKTARELLEEKKLSPEGYNTLISILDGIDTKEVVIRKHIRSTLTLSAIYGIVIACATFLVLVLVHDAITDKTIADKIREFAPVETLSSVERTQIALAKAEDPKAPIKIGGSDEQQALIALAWQISGQDKNFIAMIEAESGWRSNAIGGLDERGYCQIRPQYHPIANEPKWQIPTNQVYYCNDLFQRSKSEGKLSMTFGSIGKWERAKTNFIWE